MLTQTLFGKKDYSNIRVETLIFSKLLRKKEKRYFQHFFNKQENVQESLLDNDHTINQTRYIKFDF